MSTLDQVMEMRRQGYSDPQIIDTLREMGISPKEINDSLSQSKIKSELTQPPGYNQKTDFDQMQPSIGNDQQQDYTQQQGYYQPSTSQYVPSPDQNQNQMQDPNSYQYQEYQPQQSMDVETINDISEQIVEEKLSQVKKDLSSFNKFKDETMNQLEMFNRRIEKIENNFSDLQSAILRKVGDYGEDIRNVSNELRATQDSFSKIINPLVDKARKFQTKNTDETNESPEDKSETKPRRTKEPRDSFENYLR